MMQGKTLLEPGVRSHTRAVTPNTHVRGSKGRHVSDGSVKRPRGIDETFHCTTNSAYLRGFGRTDEQTRTADPISLRVIIHALQGFARACKSPISKGFSPLRLSMCCTVLRSRWCQSGVKKLPAMNWCFPYAALPLYGDSASTELMLGVASGAGFGRRASRPLVAAPADLR